MQYRERLEDIRMLKLKISDLKRKLHMLKQQTSNIDVLRNEVPFSHSLSHPLCRSLALSLSPSLSLSSLPLSGPTNHRVEKIALRDESMCLFNSRNT